MICSVSGYSLKSETGVIPFLTLVPDTFLRFFPLYLSETKFSLVYIYMYTQNLEVGMGCDGTSPECLQETANTDLCW